MSVVSPRTPDAVPESSEESPSQPLVRVLRGSGTEEEVAALVAVLTEAYLEEEASAVVEERAVSAWERTRRPMRVPLRRDIPWGRFHG